MSRNLQGKILQRRGYSEYLQQRFTELSGDYNPMHVDPVAARRTLVGGCAVHGIHQVLGAMEGLLRAVGQDGLTRTIVGFKALFLKPVLVGEVVAIHLAKFTEENGLIIGRIGDDIVCRITVQFGAIPAMAEAEMPPLPPESVTELVFIDLADKAAQLPLGLNVPLAREMFPLTTTMLGTRRLSATLALSRLVGMHCPGLHSIFTEATVRFDGTDDSDALHYRVENTDERFSRVALAVHGAHLQGQLVVFFRPPPQAQAGMAEVMPLVKAGSFAQSVALIVGGSRGLGEITAKIIAAGDGLPIITYHQGAADAERVAEDIRSQGGRCEALQFDVLRSEKFIRKLSAGKQVPRSLYYFATPKIFGRRRGFFDHDRLREFQEVYLTAFARMIDAMAANGKTKLRVFYPSSVAVTENVPDLVEYAMAKRTGEELCAFYNDHSKQIEIISERLPRIRTDQTNTLLQVPAEDALKVMLPVVLRIENFSTE